MFKKILIGVLGGVVFLPILFVVAEGKDVQIQKVRIGAAFYVTSNDYCRNEIRGIKDIVEAVGGKVIVADAMGDWQTHNNNIENFIAQGVDGIIIQPGFPSQIKPLVEKAHDLGIPVVTTNMEYFSEKVSTTVLPNHFLMGVEIGAQILKNMEFPYKGKVYVFLATGVYDFEERFRGLNLILSQYPGIEIKRINVPETPTAVIPDTMNKMRSLLLADSKSREIKAVYGAADFFAVGPYQAILEVGRTDIKVYGSDGDPVALKAIRSKNNVWIATCGRTPYRDGQIAAECLLEAIRGKKTPPMVASPFYTISKFDVIQRVKSIYGEDYWKKIGWKEK